MLEDAVIPSAIRRLQASRGEFVGEEALAFFDEAGNRLLEPGRFELWIAPDSAAATPAAFELVK